MGSVMELGLRRNVHPHNFAFFCPGQDRMRDLLRDEIEEQGEEIRSLRAYLYQEPLA